MNIFGIMNTVEINDDTSNIKFAKQPRARKQKNKDKGTVGMTRHVGRFFWEFLDNSIIFFANVEKLLTKEDRLF